MSEGYRSVGPYTAELTADRSGSDTYRLSLSGQVVPRAACEAVWYFLEADGKDPAPVVIEVVGSSGDLLKRKDSGGAC